MGARTKAIERKHLAVHLEVKSLDDAQGIFEGYLAVFGNEDYNGDICEKGCFNKTLIEAKRVQQDRKIAFLYPLLWMHDENQPVGGFTEMKEDSKGLYVRGQCDMDTEVGRRAFSGMTKGYMAQMSIGYNAVKWNRDAKGIRHLTEVRLWEGSVITTGYAANPQANVLDTKSRGGRSAAPGVSGKATWPLGSLDSTWDPAGARERIVAWATDPDGVLNEEKMASVHFYYDADAPGEVDAYRLPFCDVVEGNVLAIPQAILLAGEGVSPRDKTGVKKRIAAYYKRMSQRFDDPDIIAPWQEAKVLKVRELEEKGMGGLQCLTYCAAQVDTYGDVVDMYLEMLGDATGLDLDPDEGEEGEEMRSVLTQMLEGKQAGSSIDPAVQILLDNLPGLSEALVAVGQTFQAFDDATDNLLGLLGMSPMGSGGGYGYNMIHDRLLTKVGRQFSTKNYKKIKAIADSLMEHKDSLMGIIDADAQDNSSDDGSQASARRERPQRKVNVHKQPELSATTADDTADDELEPGGEIDDTTLESLSELHDEMKLTGLALSIQKKTV